MEKMENQLTTKSVARHMSSVFLPPTIIFISLIIFAHTRSSQQLREHHYG